jgi:hypothetical protein
VMNTDDLHEEFANRRVGESIVVAGRSMVLLTECSPDPNLDEAGPEDRD